MLPHPDFEIGDERFGFCLPHRDALRGRQAVDGALDLEQFVDAAHRLNGDGRFVLLCQFEEVPAAMAPACRLDDRSGTPFSVVKGVEPGEGVGLHDADIAGEMFLGMLAGTRSRIAEDGRWRILAAERSIVAHISPDPTCHGLHFGQHRHLRVVGMDAFRAAKRGWRASH